MPYDLIDEYRLLVHPVVLGSGNRFFKDGGSASTLKLVDSRTYRSGVVLLAYQRDQTPLLDAPIPDVT